MVCGDERGVHQGACAQQQAPGVEVGVAGREQTFAQVVGFEPMAEFQQRGGVGHALGGQVNPGESLQSLAVVAGVLEGCVSQAIPLLEELDPQHALQPHGRASAFALGIEWLEDGQQVPPRYEGVHAREEFFPAGDRLFRSELGLRETGLGRHAREVRKSRTTRPDLNRKPKN